MSSIAYLVLSTFASSGWCPRYPLVAREFRQSSLILVGTVTAITDSTAADDPEASDGYFYRIRVREVIRGTADTVAYLYTTNDSGRFQLDSAVTYLVFAKKGPRQGMIIPCGNTGPIADRDQKLRAVRRLAAKSRRAGA